MPVDSGLNGQKAKLPVAGTIRAAYAMVFGHLGDFVALAALPFAIGVAGQTLILFVPVALFYGLAEITGNGSYFALTVLIGFLTTFVPWAVFVVAWHRFVLLGKRDTGRPVECYLGTRAVKYYFGTREGNIFGNEFFMSIFLPGLFIILTLVVFSISSPSITFHSNITPTELVIYAVLIFISALGPFLTLPAHAIGHETSVYGGWKQVRGIAWRFFWIMLLVAIPFLFLFVQLETPGPVEMAGYDGESRKYIILAYLLITIARGLVLFIGTALFVATLCLSYRQVVGESARQANPEEAAGFSDWVVHFALPVVLALILGLVVFAITRALSIPPTREEQVLLAALAGLVLLVWKIHRLQP
jgi:hypothetical protein